MAPKLKFCRINLDKTNYNIFDYPFAKELTYDDKKKYWPTINSIYMQYCDYKNFTSVMPLWPLQFMGNGSEYRVIGYFNNHNELIAWTKLRQFDRFNIESEQFAWDYNNPELQLGIKSLEYESAYFQLLGFKYIWLGFDDHYKQKIQGFEIAGY